MTALAVGVCGFPRSGSSMTMRMLDAGGVRPVAGSSGGSYELAGGLGILMQTRAEALEGRAVKLLDYPLWFGDLPAGVEWRFIWLDRDPREQARSQVKFVNALMPGMLPETGTARLARSFRDDRPKLLAWYRLRGDVLVCSFEDILRDPLREAERMAAFVPGLDAVAAAEVPIERSASCAPDLSHEISLL